MNMKAQHDPFFSHVVWSFLAPTEQTLPCDAPAQYPLRCISDDACGLSARNGHEDAALLDNIARLKDRSFAQWRCSLQLPGLHTLGTYAPAAAQVILLQPHGRLLCSTA